MAKHHQEPSTKLREQRYQQNPAFPYDALYCLEEDWEAEVREEDCFQEGGGSICGHHNKQNYLPILSEHDLYWEDEELSSLFAREEQNQLYKNLQTNPSLALARSEAVEWILKVNAHYSFTALTAVLAVNYLDRFLAIVRLQAEKPWMTQLAAVACLSLAAKVEETQVPLLLDLQVEDSRHVFEAKTIQRMETLVLSSLEWRMNPVTPFSFLDYITRRLGLKDYLCWEFLKRCERIVLFIISDARYMQHVPSVVATAAMLHVINCVERCLGEEYQSQLLGILGIDKDKVEDCTKLIMEMASGNHNSLLNKRKFSSFPGSPNGVVDVSFSSDSSNDSWGVASSVSSSPESLSKKSRTVQRLSHAPADFVGIPR